MTILRQDNFNRSAGAIGTPSDAGSAWSTAGGWEVKPGNVGYNSGANSQSTCVLEAGESDVSIEATLGDVVITSDCGLCARQTDGSNYILATFGAPGGTGARLFSVTAGSFTQIGTTGSATVVSGDVIKLVVNGTSIESFINGVSARSGTSSAHQTVTRHGLRAHGDGQTTFEDFSISDITVAAPVFGGTVPTLTGTQGVALAAQSPTIASYFSGAGITYTVSTGLPSGLSINSGTGVISGTPSTDTDWSGYVTATNGGGSDDSNTFAITIGPGSSGAYGAAQIYTSMIGGSNV